MFNNFCPAELIAMSHSASTQQYFKKTILPPEQKPDLVYQSLCNFPLLLIQKQ